MERVTFVTLHYPLIRHALKYQVESSASSMKQTTLGTWHTSCITPVVHDVCGLSIGRSIPLILAHSNIPFKIKR